jgi:predicted RNA-binding Zn-ribbon protein involved in translation (DUF1610 family)
MSQHLTDPFPVDKVKVLECLICAWRWVTQSHHLNGCPKCGSLEILRK